jgi:hypothetical protein
MKSVYLITTSALCLQFIANYTTVLTEMLISYDSLVMMLNWDIWGIYAAWLILLSAATFIIYRKYAFNADYLKYAWTMVFAVIASVVLLVFFLLMCLFSHKFKDFMFE